MERTVAHDLQGSLAHSSIADVLQFLHIGDRTGALWTSGPDHSEGAIWIRNGELYHAAYEDLVGVDALARMISWRQGEFWFTSDESVPTVTLEAPLTSCLMQAAQRLDEVRRDEAAPPMPTDERCRALLGEFVEQAEASLAMLLTRDGTPGRAAGDTAELELDALSAAFREVVSGAGFIASVLGCDTRGEIILELDRYQAVLVSAGPARLAVIAPSTARLGVIRHRSKRLVEDLREVLESEDTP